MKEKAMTSVKIKKSYHKPRALHTPPIKSKSSPISLKITTEVIEN